jgi:hypothetical protein
LIDEITKGDHQAGPKKKEDALDSLIDRSIKKQRRVSVDQVIKSEKKETETRISELMESRDKEERKINLQIPQIPIDIREFLKKFGFWVFLIIFSIYVTILYNSILNELQVLAFFITFAVLALFVIVIGLFSEYNSWIGVAIDKRNKISLSLLQVYIWLLIILSGFIVISMYNWINTDSILFTDFIFDHLFLIGISTISAIGSTFIKNWQIDLLDYNNDPREASWQDLFMYELMSNKRTTDLGKTQLFIITLLTMIVYFFSLFSVISDATPGTEIEEVPEITGGLIPLLALSHIGYLLSKALSSSNRDFRPNPPRNLRFDVTVNPDEVELFWDEPPKKELDVKEYEVYRKIETVDLDYLRIHHIKVASDTELRFIESITDDNVRYYMVKAKNEAGFSEESNLAQVKKH